MKRIGVTATVAHQYAGGDVLASIRHRGQPMAERKESNLPVARIEVPIVANAESVGPLLHGGRDSILALTFGPGLDNDNLQPEVARCGLRTLDDTLRGARIVRIHQQGNPGGA